jgi:tetraacyldisaccharide 4'-kinase
VIVVGNITVGGAGKTPLVIALVEKLLELGFRPGVISRGYRGGYTAAWAEVEQSDSARFGDEIVLVRERTGVPAAVARKRAEAGRGLIERHPEIDVLVCDDGLQHYALARDIELAVFDARGLGNGRLLPSGPLRETTTRLSRCDALLCNGTWPAELETALATAQIGVPRFQMVLRAQKAYQLIDRGRREPLSFFAGKEVVAAAGIGVPERFFAMLGQAGLTCAALPLPDHYDFRANPFIGRTEPWILVTEKDAVKCRDLRDARVWVVPVDAQLEDPFVNLVLEKLRAWK